MRKLLYLLLPGLTVFTACEKKLEVDAMSFGVTPDSTTYHAGSNVKFIFEGNPTTITFYSGEQGRQYQYRNRVTAAGTPALQFSTALNTVGQTGSLLLMCSYDFKGVVVGDTAKTQANINSATWTDITSRAKLATNATATASGVVDLSDLSNGTPVYLAFKYQADANAIQNKWTITGLTVTNTLKDGNVYIIANLAANNTAITSNYGGVSTFSPGWVAYPTTNTYNWVVTAGTSLVITGAATAAAATSPAEAWTIMGPLDLQKVTPDIGVAIKSITLALPSYTYVYSKAGTYTATFVAANATPDAENSAVNTVDLTIQ
jgi:plastocyanin